MKLKKAEVDGFGTLYRKEMSLDAPIVVIYGPNEAGKSTMFGFIRTMLYGFARRSQPALRQEPVHGGKHGGRLFYESLDGKPYLLERYAAASTGGPRLRHLDGVTHDGENLTLTQQEWERQYLGGIHESLYRQLYAITLSELQEIGALSGEELGRYLYHAGWEGGRAIASAEKKLIQELDQLFKPRGTNPDIQKRLKTLEQVEADLRKRTDAIAAYNERSMQDEQLASSIAELEALWPETEARVLLLSKACSARPLWLQEQQGQAEYAVLSYAQRITDDAAKRWPILAQLREASLADAEQLRQQLRLVELQSAELSSDDGLISAGEAASEVLQGAERIRMLKDEVVSLTAEFREHDDAIARLTGSIAPEWTVRQLRDFHATVADRDQMRSEQARLAERERTRERLQADYEHASRQEREAGTMLSETDSALAQEEQRREEQSAELLPLDREALRAAWSAADRALREWEVERARTVSSADDSHAEQGQAGRSEAGLLWGLAAAAGGAALALAFAALGGSAGSGWAAAAFAVLAAALAFAALQRGRGVLRAARAQPRAGRSRAARSARGQAAAAAQPGGEAAVRVRRALAGLVREPEAVAAVLLAVRPSRSMQHEHSMHVGASPAVESLAGARNERPNAANSLDLSATAAAEHQLVQLQAAVEARLDSLATSERLTAQRAEQLRTCKRLRERLDELASAMSAAEQDEQQSGRRWADWLAARALPAAMSPTAALEAFELAEQALQRLLQYDRQAAKLAAAEQEIAAFARQATELCGRLEEARRQLAVDPTLALRLLQAEGGRHAAARQEALALAERHAAISLRLQAAEASIQEQLAEQSELLQAAELADESSYWTALAHREQAVQLSQELARLRLELTAGLSPSRQAELESLFQSFDEEQLEAMLRSAKEKLHMMELNRRDMLEQRGRVKQAIEHLLQEDEQRRLLELKAMTLAELEQDSERYAVLAVSSALIKRTKRIYEEEKQPVVLRKASGFIQELTDGKYIRILSSPGEAGLRLEDANRQVIDSSMLSRGTAELVYLALRLALATEASNTVTLPLMLDDVFVNFDIGRLQNITRLLAMLAKDRQIMIMTCHEHIRDAVLRSNQNSLLVQL